MLMLGSAYRLLQLQAAIVAFGHYDLSNVVVVVVVVDDDNDDEEDGVVDDEDSDSDGDDDDNDAVTCMSASWPCVRPHNFSSA